MKTTITILLTLIWIMIYVVLLTPSVSGWRRDAVRMVWLAVILAIATAFIVEINR